MNLPGAKVEDLVTSKFISMNRLDGLTQLIKNEGLELGWEC